MENKVNTANGKPMLALVTGASSGIGLMYAHELARTYKCDLLLVSNQEKEIAETANDIASKYGVHTIPLYRDLAKQDAAEELHQWCHDNGIEPDILINNAGVFFFNPLVETSMKRIELMLMLHVVTVTKLCRLFGEDMCKRGKGYILNMSSMSAWMAMPGIQCYNATKAYLLNFSKSLWYEFKPYGVGVTVMTPGAVDTALYGLAPNLRRLAVNLTVSIPPEKLVQRALKKMFKRKKQDMPGVLNHLFLPVMKHLPDWVVFFMIRKIGRFQK
ncbi:MAG: SDR family NAD(P)-dependent oxidoreductase [Bacteroidales bacterium]|nr:SDR family NAD(P)-dependent oxidoreductase [Bacteroidales bacterium]